MAKRRANGEGSIRKRKDGRWEGRIVIGHKNNGDSIFRYIYAPTQKELTTKLRQNINAYQGVDLTEESGMTLSQWLDIWLEQRMVDVVRPTTLNGYWRDLEYHVKPYLGQKPLLKITAKDLNDLYAQLLEHGRIIDRGGHGPSLSTSTVRGIHTTLHHALKMAVKEGVLPANPADEATPPKICRTAKGILNSDQLNKFMAAIENDQIWHDFFYTEMTTGLRRGELCGLKWEDLDCEAGTLKVRRTIHTGKGGTLTAGDPKTYAGTRDILLPYSTAQLLQKRRETALTEWIFPNPVKPEQPANPGMAYRELKRLLTTAGLPDIRFHDLRHTFATHALASGVDAKTLSGILGHTKASFTLDTYTHVTGDMQRRAAEIVGDFITEILGEGLSPWQRNENEGTEVST